MRVTVSTIGRFHAFDLADQLRERGCLARLYTAYPKFKVSAALRPFTRTLPWLYCFVLAAQRAGLQAADRQLNWLAIDRFDRWAARSLEPADVLVHLSGFGLHTARRARSLGARVVCDRGSSHIAYQDELLAEEHARQGVPYSPIDRRIVEKELEEYAQADLITVPSTFAYRSFVLKGVPAGKLRKLPYGVDLSLFRPLPKQDERFRILFVGSYSVQKGIGYLLEAVRPLVANGHVEAWLVGRPSPEARPILTRYAGTFVDKGLQPRSRLSWFYSQCSLLVQPSVQEGMSLVQAQAMACGIPVVATTNTGAEDLLQDGVEGFVVPVRDPAAIRERISWMLDNPGARREMGRAALRRVRQLDGWGAYGERAMNLYAGLAQGCAERVET